MVQSNSGDKSYTILGISLVRIPKKVLQEYDAFPKNKSAGAIATHVLEKNLTAYSLSS